MGKNQMVKQELRACYVNEHKALFHCWEERADLCAPSMLVGGHPGGVRKYTLGIVEYEDGTVHEVLPTDITFIDTKIFDQETDFYSQEQAYKYTKEWLEKQKEEK